MAGTQMIRFFAYFDSIIGVVAICTAFAVGWFIDDARDLSRNESSILGGPEKHIREDGYALMRQLREIEPELGRQIPAMALTGYGRPQDRTRILASGFQKYIQKPVEPMVLAHAIAELLRT